VKQQISQLPPESLIRAYAGLRSLEARAEAIEEVLGNLRQRCLSGGPAVLPDLVVASGELRWHVRQLEQQYQDFHAALGAGAMTDLPERRSEQREHASMRGTTDVLAVSDLVSMLSNLRKTGTLTLQAGGSMFAFEFNAGAVVHAVTNRANKDLRLGTILVAQSKITEDQLRANLVAGTRDKEMLGARLVRTQTVSATDLRAALEEQVRRIFDEAFALQNARFSFFEGSVSEIAERASLNTTCLLLEAARQHDEGQSPPARTAAKSSRRGR
jgi:hypothetical protein